MEKTHTIWFVNTFEPVAPLYKAVIPKFQEAGISVTALLCASDYRNLSENRDSARTQQNYTFIKTPYFLGSNKRLSLFLYWLFGPFKLLFSPCSLFIFLTQPPLFYILGSAIARLRNIPYTVHIMDAYPEIFTSLGILKKENLFYKILSNLSNLSLTQALNVIVIGHCMRDDLIKNSIDPEKIIIIPNWADKTISPIKKEDNNFIKTNKLEGKFVILYSGNMGIAHEFQTILETAKLLSSYEDIVFVFIGKGVRRNDIIKELDKDESNMILLSYQEFDVLPQSLSAADIHFISLRPSFTGLVVPSKFYGALASGRPIIFEGEDRCEIACVIKENNCGFVVQHRDANTLSNKILYYYNHRINQENDGKNAFHTYEREYADLDSRYVQHIVQSIEKTI